MRTWSLPEKGENETNEAWVARAAASIPADELMILVIAYLDRRKSQRRSPTWSVIADITGHGSSVSEAIANRFRKPAEGG